MGQRLPIASNTLGDVNLERLSFDLLTGQEGRRVFSEAHRTLESRGVVSGITGGNADPADIAAAMKAVGFKNINVSYGIDGEIIFSGTKP